MTRRDGSAKVLEALRASAPELDELRRARMERRLIEAVGRREVSARPARRSRAAVATGGIVALAAAVALGWIAVGRLTGTVETRTVARFEMGGARTASGTLDAGGTLEVGAGERAEVQVGGVTLGVTGGSTMRFTSLEARDVRVALARGAVDVAFHPRERGRERLSIETPSARIEVVGTEFTVRLEGSTTHVAVREGTVRVVPQGTSESAVLVHAGESVAIHGEPAASSAPPEPSAPPPSPSIPVASASPEAPVARAAAPSRPRPREIATAETPPTPPPPPSAEQRLSTARRVLEHGEHSRARALLDELARAPDASLDVRVEAQTLVGDSLLATGAPPLAAEAYARAAEMGRGRPEGHVAIFALARLQERSLRDRDAARATYLRYLAEAPRGANAELARDAVCRLGGDPSVECGGPR